MKSTRPPSHAGPSQTPLPISLTTGGVRRIDIRPTKALGPLAMAHDLIFPPFELTVRIPAAWSIELYAEAAASILKRFVLRYRGLISYAQHL